MSNYSPIVTYGPKDSLAHGDPNKAIKGSQMDAELNAIATAISTKLDNSLANITITGSANQNALTINGSATSGQSFGEVITAGSTSADNALLVRNNAGGQLFRVRGDGEIFCGPLDLTPVDLPFTANLTGALVAAGQTLRYFKIGTLISVYCLVDYFGNSNLDNRIVITSLPVALRPTTTLWIPTNMSAGNPPTVFGNVSITQITSAGVATAFYGGGLPASTIFGFAKGSILFQYVIV